MSLPVRPPVAPMLAKLARTLPPAEGMLFEPKWDGFRSIVFRDGDQVELGSRNERPLTRYFPELLDPLRAYLPERCVLDGEIVIAGEDGLEFEALLQRIHPADSRVQLLARTTPASFVAFDLLALDDRDLRPAPFAERRAELERVLSSAKPPVHLTPATTDRQVAEDWFVRFEGAGLDGVVAKRLDLPYREDERVMMKVKHERTADCVVAGFRWHKSGGVIGSLLLGLYDEEATLHHVGVTASFTLQRRRELVQELAPYRVDALDGHPWQGWAEAEAHAASAGRKPGAPSRWNAKKDLSWEPLRAELVCEVAYDHLQGDRFRHATTFRRWRPDRQPRTCTYGQLETAVPAELAAVFGA
ncbi:MAG: ATP-dependent DNA ligase [Actinobacteria bacterium]|nr:MAG: ATP-dependent DNA ligase [Actinomycetota bacterium]